MGFLKGIKNNIPVLGMTSLFTDISSEMLYPIIPIFLTSVLGAPIQVVGLIEGLAEASASMMKAASGALSDMIKKRRPLVILGYLSSALSKPLLFFAYSWPMVLAARFIDRLGKGIRTSPRDAIIADSVDFQYRGKAFGFHRMMDSVGACIGPLLALWCLAYFKDNLRVIFLLAFIPAAIAVLILIFFLKEALPASVSGRAKWPFKLPPLSSPLKKFFLISAVFALGNSSDAFLILRSKQLGISTAIVILLYVLYNISYSSLSMSFGSLSDRIPRKKVMIMGYGVFAVVYLFFGAISSPAALWALFPVYGVYIAMTDGVGKAMVADMAHTEYRATVLGLYHFILGIFAFFASLIAGLLWAHLGASAPFFYGAVTASLSCLGLAILL